MAEWALIKSSLILMVAGMGMTFLFLLIQTFCTNLNSRLCEKFKYLVPDPEPKKPAAKPAAKTSDDSEIVAAIAAAIHHASK